MKTFSVKPADIKKEWLVVDATDQTLGRLATEVARVLRGKHKPTFTPYIDCGDHVIVINASKIKLSGNKMKDKIYYHHTRFIGGIKARSAEVILNSHPERLLMAAVKGMLPKNKLASQVLSCLRVFPGAEHTHAPQKPKPFMGRLGEQA